MKLNVLDLFCGAGGFSKGFDLAGFNTVLGVDFNDFALQSFERNHTNGQALKLDLFDLSNVEKIKQNLNDRKLTIDVLIGGPPCQGVSITGKRIVDDEKNALYRAMIKTAKELKPKIVVLENVPNLLSIGEGIIKEKIITDFSNIGYYVAVKVLYAPEYGVPQIRKRAFFIAISKSFLKEQDLKLNTQKEIEDFLNNLYPAKQIQEEKDFITIEQALSDLPDLNDVNELIKDPLKDVYEYKTEPKSDYQKLMRKDVKTNKVFNSQATIHSEEVRFTIGLVPEGRASEYLKELKKEGKLPDRIKHKDFKYRNAYMRMDRNKLSKTIDTGHNNYFHYQWNRIATVRECARLQSFPDDFIFCGSKTQQLMQVGNAVPPLLSKAIAERLKDFLENPQNFNNIQK